MRVILLLVVLAVIALVVLGIIKGGAALLARHDAKRENKDRKALLAANERLAELEHVSNQNRLARNYLEELAAIQGDNVNMHILRDILSRRPSPKEIERG